MGHSDAGAGNCSVRVSGTWRFRAGGEDESRVTACTDDPCRGSTCELEPEHVPGPAFDVDRTVGPACELVSEMQRLQSELFSGS